MRTPASKPARPSVRYIPSATPWLRRLFISLREARVKRLYLLVVQRNQLFCFFNKGIILRNKIVVLIHFLIVVLSPSWPHSFQLFPQSNNILLEEIHAIFKLFDLRLQTSAGLWT